MCRAIHASVSWQQRQQMHSSSSSSSSSSSRSSSSIYSSGSNTCSRSLKCQQASWKARDSSQPCMVARVASLTYCPSKEFVSLFLTFLVREISTSLKVPCFSSKSRTFSPDSMWHFTAHVYDSFMDMCTVVFAMQMTWQ